MTSHNEQLSDHTTLRVGGLADRVVVAQEQAELIDIVRECDAQSEPLLLLGGGSNVLISDDGWRGTVVLIRTEGVSVTSDACSGASVTVEAGYNWADFAQQAVDSDWSGIEALVGIPGSVGATPIQNVGAYGQDVSQTIARVRTFDRQMDSTKTFHFADCDFAYRNSVFKRNPGRYVILDVTYQLKLDHHSQPVRYAELAQRLGVEVGQRSTNKAVSEAVLELRSSKGMLLDDIDHDTWSVGSFFVNPIVTPAQAQGLDRSMPHWQQPDGTYKLSAAWLIEHSGHARGFGLNNRAQLSSKHTLALTNRGEATATDIIELALHLQREVSAKFGVDLEFEPNLVGSFS